MTANDSAPGGQPGARGDQRGTRSAAMLARRTDNPFRLRIVDDACDPDSDRETLLTRYHQERARRTLVIGSIRAHLEEQPSDRTVRAAGRRWSTEITNLANSVVAARKGQEGEQ